MSDVELSPRSSSSPLLSSEKSSSLTALSSTASAAEAVKISLENYFLKISTNLNFLKMKSCTSTDDSKLMDTRVLMPAEFSLVVSPRPLPPLDRLLPLEDSIKVCATRTLAPHTRYLPFSGTVRADNLPLLPYLQPLDLRVRYGGYDAVDAEGRRTCNWVRFLRVTPVYTPDVTIIGRKIGSEVVFDVIREVEAGAELLAFLFPECGPTGEDTNLILPALQLLRSSLYKRTIDSIIAETPLDLSKSLLTSPNLTRDRQSPTRTTPSPTHSDESSGISPRSSPASSPEHTPQFPPSPPSLLSRPSYFSSQQNRPLVFPAPSLLSPHGEFRFPNFITGRFSGLTPPASPNTTTAVSSISPSSANGLDSSSSSSASTALTSLAPIKRRERTMLPCSECGKTFDRPSLLKRHMRTHTGEKPHVCDVCGKGFSTSSSLNTHRRIHSGEKPHQCGVCGKRFTASSNLYYHKMTHVKEKPHKCSLCTRSFPTPGDLRSHMFVHNGQWPHKCGVCGKGFSKLTNLRNHTILHSSKTRVPSPPMSPIPIPI